MIKAARVALQEQGVPEWLRLLPFGEIELVDGREKLIFDQEGAAAVLAAWRRRQTDLVVDYEHQSLRAEAPILAAGWIKDLEVRADGLWARVEWTPRARGYIEAKEYRYFSPVLEVDEDRRVVGLVSVALTNTPAMAAVPALAAKAAKEEAAAQAERSRRYGIGIKPDGHVTKPAAWQDVPDDQWGDPVNYRYPCHTPENARAAWSYWRRRRNRREYSEAKQQIITARIQRLAKEQGVEIMEESMREELAAMLRLAPEAEDAAIVAAVAELGQAAGLVQELGQVLGLEGPTPGKIKGAVLALKEGRDRLAVVEQELQFLQAERRQEKAREQVAAAVQAGKIIPAQREWALSYAQSDPEGFAAYVASAPVQVPVQEAGARGQGPEAGGQVMALSREELAMCRAVGVSPEAFKAARQAERRAAEGE